MVFLTSSSLWVLACGAGVSSLAEASACSPGPACTRQYGLIYLAGTYCNDVGAPSSHCTATVFEAQRELLLLLQAC
jgi:hypothetical protein